MERTRAAPPTSTANVSVNTLTQQLPSLSMLIQEVRSPGVVRADIDALLRSLSRPLAPNYPARERADLLLSIIEDNTLSDFTGTDGRTVRGAAIQALLALGYPYALEVPPEALAAQIAAKQDTPRDLLSEPKGRRGFWIICALGGLMLIPGIMMSVQERSMASLLIALTFIGCFSFFPALLTLFGHNARSRILKSLGTIWLLLISLLWMGPALFALGSGTPWGLIPLGMGGVFLYATWLMSSKSEPSS